MKYYAIRHKTTGELMPLMKRGRGYSHWNPGTVDEIKVYAQTEIPRLLKSKRQAERVIIGWFTCPNSRNDYDGDIKIGLNDNRSKTDLEIISLILSIHRNG